MEYKTDNEKKCAALTKKFNAMYEFEAEPQALDLMEFDKLYNILTNLNSVALTIAPTIQSSMEDFKNGDLLLVKPLIDLLYLHFHLTKQITTVAVYIDKNFDDEGNPILPDEEE